MTTRHIAIIGGGFSGTLLALHLLNQGDETLQVSLIERDRSFGRGLAYATANPNHLLNVPAGRMSAFADQPSHFLQWLQEHGAEAGFTEAPHAETFVPRRIYGAYIRHLLARTCKGPDGDPRLRLIGAGVTDLRADGDGWCLTLDKGDVIQADRVVLATGNLPPEPPGGSAAPFYDSGFYRADPWDGEATADLPPDAPILIIGTGLTMVDTVIDLLDRGHRGPIQALSRRGLLPRRHVDWPAYPAWLPEIVPTNLSALTRLARQEVRRAEAAGLGWRAVIDALRPVTQTLWQRLGTEGQRRFLRHLRPWWDVHRHRMAPQIADRIEAAQASGQLTILRGRIGHYRAAGDRVQVDWCYAGGAPAPSLSVGRVINCSGPSSDYARIRHSLLRRLLDAGVIRPDPLHLGLDVDDQAQLIATDGTKSAGLYAIGPITKGKYWEIIAVPDIRRQCLDLSAALLG